MIPTMTYAENLILCSLMVGTCLWGLAKAWQVWKDRPAVRQDDTGRWRSVRATYKQDPDNHTPPALVLERSRLEGRKASR